MLRKSGLQPDRADCQDRNIAVPRRLYSYPGQDRLARDLMAYAAHQIAVPQLAPQPVAGRQVHVGTAAWGRGPGLLAPSRDPGVFS